VGSSLPQHAASIEAAIKTGQATRSALVASWCRSARLHQLDPCSRQTAARLDDGALRHVRGGSEALVRTAQPAMTQLFQAVGASGCCVLLADSDGVVIERRGMASDDATFESWGLWTGAVWSEQHEGTNGIGTCLVERRSVTIDRAQHFLSRNIAMSCTGSPIFNHEARLAGVLDVSSCRADRTEGFANLIALAAGEAARAIEAALFRTAFTGARIVLGPPNDRGSSGLIAIDGDDLVVGATRGARLALGISPEGPLRPVPAADLLGGDSRHERLGDAERGALQRALLRSGGNVSAAAHALGMSRATLHRKLKRCELRPHR
jgi:transcriptional regulator of acetoin/glycerol metabolism